MIDDHSFKKLLEALELSWEGYRRVRKGVKRRLARHMQELGTAEIEGYLELLHTNSAALHKTRELLTVSISRFFRDRRLWEVLGARIVPELMRQPTGPVRVWSAGCARGEEVYSLKILWEETAQATQRRAPPLEILATDMNPVVLQKAREGLYPPSSLKELSASLRNKYFIRSGSEFAIRDDLKQGIHWHLHDLLSEKPSESSFDLIFLRNNLLTYCADKVRIPVFPGILEALRPGGYLVIGNKEELPSIQLPLERSPEYRSLYRFRKPGANDSAIHANIP